MVTALGIACVAWTTFELIGLLRARSLHETSAAKRATAGRLGRDGSASRRYRRFAAWDDRGRPIRVEDLGPR